MGALFAILRQSVDLLQLALFYSDITAGLRKR